MCNTFLPTSVALPFFLICQFCTTLSYYRRWFPHAVWCFNWTFIFCINFLRSAKGKKRSDTWAQEVKTNIIEYISITVSIDFRKSVEKSNNWNLNEFFIVNWHLIARQLFHRKNPIAARSKKQWRFKCQSLFWRLVLIAVEFYFPASSSCVLWAN